jgi:hypothetical protein
VGLAGKAVTAYVFPTDKISQGWSTDWHSVLERSFFCQADLFSFGMALAVVYSLWIKGQLHLPRHWQFTAVALALLAYVAASRVSSMEAQLTYSPYNTLMALACALLLALVVLARPGGSHFVRILETRAFVVAGVMSTAFSVALPTGARAPRLRSDVRRTRRVRTQPHVGADSDRYSFRVTYRYIEAPALKVKFARREDPRSERKPPSSDVQARPQESRSHRPSVRPDIERQSDGVLVHRTRAANSPCHCSSQRGARTSGC